MSTPGSSLEEGLFSFLPLFPVPPFPLIAATASDHNLLEKNNQSKLCLLCTSRCR